MIAEANALLATPGPGPVVAPAEIPATRRLWWSLRRELWENRSLYLPLLAVAGLVLLGAFIGAFALPAKLRAAAALGAAQQHQALAQPYEFTEFLLMGTTFIVTIFYCLDALHSERRDRSILFWKSLPVSDLTTVLTKASIPIAFVPLLTFAVTVVTQLAMLLLDSAFLLASGQGAGLLWAQVAPLQMWGVLLFHLVAVHGLWYAPIWGWMLLVSAWARRAPILWASVPLLAIGIVERIAFGTSWFATLLMHRMSGEAQPAASPGISMNPLMPMTPGELFASPGLWIGLAVAGAFLAGAVRLRRRRGPI